jgi:hypothetical protein
MTGDESFVAADGGTQVDFELRVVTGAEGARLARAQARAIQEVLAWLTAQRQSEHGPDRAA